MAMECNNTLSLVTQIDNEIRHKAQFGKRCYTISYFTNKGYGTMAEVASALGLLVAADKLSLKVTLTANGRPVVSGGREILDRSVSPDVTGVLVEFKLTKEYAKLVSRET